MNDRPRSARYPWLRPALFTGVMLLLPLNWVEETHPGCSGVPASVQLQRGVDLLGGETALPVLVAALVSLASLVVCRLRSARPVTRFVAHLSGALVTGWLALLVHFSIHFSVVSQRALWPGRLATVLVVASALEATVRAVLSLVELVKRPRPR